MKYSDQKPPNWDKLVSLFGADWSHAVVTWGDTVHARRPVTPDLEVHESVHVRQQAAMGVEAWWERYYEDPAFRLDQELEAYRAQYQFFKRSCKDRNIVFRFQHRIASDFSGPIYGNCIGYRQAFDQVAQSHKAVAA